MWRGVKPVFSPEEECIYIATSRFKPVNYLIPLDHCRCLCPLLWSKELVCGCDSSQGKLIFSYEGKARPLSKVYWWDKGEDQNVCCKNGDSAAAQHFSTVLRKPIMRTTMQGLKTTNNFHVREKPKKICPLQLSLHTFCTTEYIFIHLYTGKNMTKILHYRIYLSKFFPVEKYLLCSLQVCTHEQEIRPAHAHTHFSASRWSYQQIWCHPQTPVDN